MTTFANLPTLLDHAKRTDPNGSIANIAELLTQQNEILLDVPWMEGNMETGHQSTQRTGLPTAYWRMANQGVPKSKSTTAQITDQCGRLEARGEIDVRVAEVNGNTPAFRLSENVAHMEAMNQGLTEALFYGNTSANPEQFMGLAPRYSSLSAGNGGNIIDALGDSTDNTSIWLVCWSEQTAFMMYPKGQTAGLQHQDLGEGDAFDENNDRFRALMDLYIWRAGLVVKDWRYVVRIANIDVSNLTSGSSAADLIDTMITAYHKLPSPNMGRCAWYCNRTVKTMLHKQARDQANVYLTPGKEEGEPKVSCLNIPIRTADRIANTEARVT